ncbi:MAG: glycogen debranching protein, partial [Gammaproteobacteria bacterium]|nr:glycogen debranching protein [Gammaproteobacteria bacterium]
AWRILEHFSTFVNEGLLPNNFPGEGEVPEYNTVDASLWYIEAWRAWLQATNDLAAVEEVLPLLEEIIYAYHDGTRYGIAVDPQDGLLIAGEKGQQLTWMDARVDGREITPRHGKPVEINALWYNALQSVIDFCEQLDHPADEFKSMAEQCRQGFARFIRPDGMGLYDVLDGPHGNDEAIRPNQIFALSLTYTPLHASVMRSVIDVCRDKLLTPYGLRSLSPDDERYVGRYEGGVAQRDGSYHQGPVWGWLLGHYALAEYRVTGDAQGAQDRLAGMEAHLFEAGLGSISEIFDGDTPHAPRGAPSQAWSVACTLEAWWKLERAKIQ